MQQRQDIETVMYRQKRAHKKWMSSAVVRSVSPSPEASQLVWELMVTYAEAAPDVEPVVEDLRQTAHELAELVLTDMPVERVEEIYRDSLIDAILDESGECTPEECRGLVLLSNTVSSAICEANSELLKRTIRHNRAEHLSDEMKLAKRIQSYLLPKVIPKIPGFEFAGRVVPAMEVGGDYWSIKQYKDDGVVTMKLADVSGHGVAAATLVAAVKFISGGYYRGSSSPAEVMRQTNRVLSRETPYDVLVSMVYGWLRPEACSLTIVNAGHEPAFVCSDKKCIDIPPTGPVLGVAEDAFYGEETYTLKKGEIVFFGSDGITEAGIGEPFGMARLKELVMQVSDLSADGIADKVIEAVTAYVDQPHDDISLLIVKVTGDSPHAP